MLSPLSESESESACISLSIIAAALRGGSSELGVGIVNTTSGTKASGTPTPPPGPPLSLAARLAICTPPPPPPSPRPTLANTGSVLGASSTATTSAGHEYAENDAILSSSEKLTRACRVDPASLCAPCLSADLAGDTDRGSGTCLVGINSKSPPPTRPPTPVRVNSNVSSGPDDDESSSSGICRGVLVAASSAILSSSLLPPLSMWSWW